MLADWMRAMWVQEDWTQGDRMRAYWMLGDWMQGD